MFFRQICCFSVLLILSMVSGKLWKQGVSGRDIIFCLAIGFVGISLSQYFQLQNFKTLLYQTGVHRLAIWQSIVPVLVTLISIVLRLEPATVSRYVAIGLDLTMMGLVLVSRLIFDVGEFGENQSNDRWYLLYIMLVIFSNSVQFVLTKLLF